MTKEGVRKQHQRAFGQEIPTRSESHVEEEEEEGVDTSCSS